MENADSLLFSQISLAFISLCISRRFLFIGTIARKENNVRRKEKSNFLEFTIHAEFLHYIIDCPPNPWFVREHFYYPIVQTEVIPLQVFGCQVFDSLSAELYGLCDMPPLTHPRPMHVLKRSFSLA